ncbi:Uncharacterized protein TCM_037361 [Theobroma cacao]|uniref:Uncharacterized protein n=1 Tax=Theobroma cacao TaxID=3641 RepID=A0A061GKE3_THECC|nr:Uncharacterized protein TCM_037361 [Theobroma cacao]
MHAAHMTTETPKNESSQVMQRQRTWTPHAPYQGCLRHIPNSSKTNSIADLPLFLSSFKKEPKNSVKTSPLRNPHTPHFPTFQSPPPDLSPD